MTVDIVTRLDTLIGVTVAPTAAADWTTITPLTANPAYVTETGDVGLQTLTFPDDVTGETLSINGTVYTVLEPANYGALITALNGAYSSVEFVDAITGPNHFLRYTATGYGTLTFAGSLMPVVGLTTGSFAGGWYSLGTTVRYLEVGFQGLTCSGAPTTVILRVWRRNDQTVDMVGEVQIPYASASTFPSQRMLFDGDTVAISVAFVGGAAPAITAGTIRVRAVSSGATTVGVATELKQDTEIATISAASTAITNAVNTMGAKLPATLGEKTSSGSLSVTMSSDEDEPSSWQTVQFDLSSGAPAIPTHTGNVDLTGFSYPGDFGSDEVEIGPTTFQLANPASEAELLTQLNGGSGSDYVWDIDSTGGTRYLRVTKQSHGSFYLGGSVCTTAGLTAADYGNWTTLPSIAKYLEVARSDQVLTGDPDIIYRVWRLETNGNVNVAGEVHIHAADLATFPTKRVAFDGDTVAVTVQFVGGTNPSLTGHFKVRSVKSEDTPDDATLRGIQDLIDDTNDLVGTIRHTEVPNKANLARGPLEVDKRGNTYVNASLRHKRRVVLPIAADTVLGEGPCDAIRVDTDNVVVYGQLNESPWIVTDGATFADAAKWGGANWAVASNKVTHTAGSTADLTTTLDTNNPVIVGETYCTVLKVSGRTAGSVTLKLGTGAGTARSADGTFVEAITCTASAAVTVTPTNDFDGSVEILKVFQGTLPLQSGAWEAESYYQIAGVAALAPPTTLSSTIKVSAGWYRRASGAVLG